MVQVVVAIIQREGRILIGQHTPEQSRPLKWEFPGGKVEPDETPPQAVMRELREELGIQNARGAEIMRYEFAYPGKQPILLIFYRITEFEGEPQNLIYREMRWEPAEKLHEFDFLEGDREFLQVFAAGLY